MPLISSYNHGHLGQTYLWWIKEEQRYFMDELRASGIDLSIVDGWHPNRQREWLSGRNLVNTYIHHPIISMAISPQGKPYFDDPEMHFSISHSKSMAAITISRQRVGLDIQMTNPKMDRLAHKFVNPDEMDLLPQRWSSAQKQHFIWCAKEAMFKAYGEGEVDFRKHLTITTSIDEHPSGDLRGKLEKSDVSIDFIIRYRKQRELHICHAWEE